MITEIKNIQEVTCPPLLGILIIDGRSNFVSFYPSMFGGWTVWATLFHTPQQKILGSFFWIHQSIVRQEIKFS